MENVLGHYDNFYTTICETDNLHEDFNNQEYLETCNLPLSDTSDDNVLPNIFVKIPLHCQNNSNSHINGGSSKQNNDIIKSEPIKSEFSDSKTNYNSCTTLLRNNNKANFPNQRDSLPLTLPSNDLVTARPKTNQTNIIKCYKCANCQFLSISSKTLNDHYKNVHKNSNVQKKLAKLLCPGCENIFYTKKSLETHLINDHQVNDNEIELLLNYSINNNNNSEQCKQTTNNHNTTLIDDNLLNNDRHLIDNDTGRTIDLTYNRDVTMKKSEDKTKTRLYIKNVNILKKPNLISPSTTPQPPIISSNNNNNIINNNTINQNNSNSQNEHDKTINNCNNNEIINESNLISYDFPIISTNSFENTKQQQDLDDNNIDNGEINTSEQEHHREEEIIIIKKQKECKQSKIFIKNVDILKEPKYNINFMNNNSNNIITTIPPTSATILQSNNNYNTNNLLTTNTDDYFLSQNSINDNQYQQSQQHNFNSYNNSIITNQIVTNTSNKDTKRVKKNYKIKKKNLLKEKLMTKSNNNKYLVNDVTPITTEAITGAISLMPLTVQSPNVYKTFDDIFNNVVIDSTNFNDIASAIPPLSESSSTILNEQANQFNSNHNTHNFNNIINNFLTETNHNHNHTTAINNNNINNDDDNNNNNNNNIIILDDNNIEEINDLFLNNHNDVDCDMTSSNETITASIDTNLDLDKSTIINDNNNTFINYNNHNNNNNYIFYDNYVNASATNLIDTVSNNNFNSYNSNTNNNHSDYHNTNNLYNFNNENDITVIEEEVTSTTFNEKLNINDTRIRETDKDILFICAEEIINSINVVNDSNSNNNNNNNNNDNDIKCINNNHVNSEKGRIYVVNNLLKETTGSVTSVENMPTPLITQQQENIGSIPTESSITPPLKKGKKLTKKGSGRLKGSRNSGITKLKKNKINITPELIGHKCLIIDCGMRFLNVKNLNLHYKCHLNEKIICPECNYNQCYSSWNTLHTHLWRQHKIDMELYSCNLCDFKTPLLARLKNVHLKIHSNDKNYKCNYCDNTFKNIKQLKNHRRIHTRVNNNNNNVDPTNGSNLNLLTIIKCEQCSSIFTNRNVYKQHIKDNHNQTNEFFCKKCKFVTNSNAELKKHMKKVHINIGRYKCDNCSHTTSDHNAFRRHKLTHNPTKGYNCPYCAYTAIQSIPYRDHILRKHADQAANCIYKCDVKNCKFVTINKKQYDVHMMKHERMNEANIFDDSLNIQNNNVIKINDDDQECNVFENNNNSGDNVDKTDNNSNLKLLKNNRPKLAKIKLKLQSNFAEEGAEEINFLSDDVVVQTGLPMSLGAAVAINNNNDHVERLPLIRPACFANNFSHIDNIKLFNKNYDNSKILYLSDHIELGQQLQQQPQHQIYDNL